MKHRCHGSSGIWRSAIAMSVVILFAGGAHAAELRLPQAKPSVAFDVPDDWTIDRTGKSVEMRAPEKNAIVVAEVIGRDKAILDAWTKHASTKLKAFGIVFDPQAKGPPKPTAAPIDETSAFTKQPDKFTFSGQPSLATPGTPGSNDPVKPSKNSIESLTALDPALKSEPKKMPKLPFHGVQIYGTTLNGKPVDVQVVIYNLPDKRIFVMMQESGADDGRTVAMATSVRSVKTVAKQPASKPSVSKQSTSQPPPAEDGNAPPNPEQ